MDEVTRAALYPERAYADFRLAVAEWLDVPEECVVPAHGAQALISAIATTFIDPGTAVVIPQTTYGLYAQVSAAGGAAVTRVPGNGLAFDLPAIAAAAHATSARLVWLCDPNNPTGILIGRDEWAQFLLGCRATASPWSTRPTSTSPTPACASIASATSSRAGR